MGPVSTMASIAPESGEMPRIFLRRSKHGPQAFLHQFPEFTATQLRPCFGVTVQIVRQFYVCLHGAAR